MKDLARTWNAVGRLPNELSSPVRSQVGYLPPGHAGKSKARYSLAVTTASAGRVRISAGSGTTWRENNDRLPESIIDAKVKRGIGSAVRSHVQPQDRASWTAGLQAEMDAAIATNHLSSVPVQLRSLTISAFGGHGPLPGRDIFPLGAPR